MRFQGAPRCPRVPTLLLLLWLNPLPTFARTTTSVTMYSEQTLNSEDFLKFSNVPETVSDCKVHVHYLCSNPCIVNLEVVASSEFRSAVPIIKKKWRNENHLYVHRTRKVDIKFPSIMVYRDDYVIRNSIIIRSVLVRAWISHQKFNDQSDKTNGTSMPAVVKTFAVLRPLPPFQRPFKDHRVCLAWNIEILWKIEENRIPQCAFEDDTIQILNFTYASSGGHHGIIKKFGKFQNRELEARRQQLVDYPIFTFSIWMYLLNYCSHLLCGILHHIDPNNMYTTPLLFLTEEGSVHIQLQLVKGSDFAVKTNFKLPIRNWFRLDFVFDGRQLTVMTHGGERLEHRQHQVFSFAEDVYHNDTSGFCVLGGSKYVPGIQGFFGPVKYYRLRALGTQEINNPHFGREIAERISLYYKRCSSIQDIVYLYINVLQQGRTPEAESTLDYYSELDRRYGEKPVCPGFPWGKQLAEKYSNLLNLLHEIDLEKALVSENPLDMVREIGERMFKYTSKKLSRLDGLEYLTSSIPALEDSSCCGYHKASHLLAVMYETGLSMSVDSMKGLLYSLVGAQGEDGLAVMKLGYKHNQGIDNYPLDLDLSYAYYNNIAKKTALDLQTFQGEQAYVETVRIMEDETLKSQTKENGDVFLWLKHEAARGDAVAQHRLAQMLFWGQQGIAKNAEAAVEWYEKGALENEDPLTMYDYAIVLFKGHGVQKNAKLALKLMRKAAAQGSHQAVNGLGWYYHALKKNYTKAVKYWTKADKMGNVDSAYNLGVMYLDGIHPLQPGKNETLAFEYIHRAAKGGHLEGAILSSHYFVTGSLDSVPRDQETATLWVKHAAEQNGYLGFELRKALDAYLEMSWHESLLHYLLTAETGVEMSQTNLAYLCEEKPELAARYLSINCVWRYYNFSVFQNEAPSFAYLKMGDLYYYGLHNHSKDLEMAVWMYTQSALLDDSQGFFNLALLLEEGFMLQEDLLEQLKIYTTADPSNVSILLQLYERCRSLSNDESISPCSLALTYFYVKVTWESIPQSALVIILGSLLLTTLIALAMVYFHSLTGTASLERSESSQDGNPATDTASSIPSETEEGTVHSNTRHQALEEEPSHFLIWDTLLTMISTVTQRPEMRCQRVSAKTPSTGQPWLQNQHLLSVN
ncbi:hypothetical protein NDU88_002097 [Pleurodeles waltl]|uniref:Protein sel-1 homolog 3 n=1 Tax=Pleurodeles waltl TaxID=8319 RepID=A0AAV7WRC5_PLEWA|nr:hypothetical protein NDU88_002097 [Pleurodeles waltl]